MRRLSTPIGVSVMTLLSRLLVKQRGSREGSMPLVRNGRFQPDPFVRIGADWELPIDSVNLGKVIVPFEWLADLANNWPNNSQIGVQIATTITLDELAPHLDRLALVAIGFPAVSDGRGFSIAK